MMEKANLVYEYHDILVTKIARDENIEEIRTLNIAKENIKTPSITSPIKRESRVSR